MSSEYDIKTSTLFLLGFLGTVVVVVLVLAMMILYQQAEDQLQYERSTSQPNVPLENALADQQIKLVEYRKVGVVEENGVTQSVYRIPIEQAMELELTDWKSGRQPGPPPAPQASNTQPEAGKRSELREPAESEVPGKPETSEKPDAKAEAKAEATETKDDTAESDDPPKEDAAKDPVAEPKKQPATESRPSATDEPPSSDEDQAKENRNEKP